MFFDTETLNDLHQRELNVPFGGRLIQTRALLPVHGFSKPQSAPRR
jgi:hypothetical protein